MREIPVDFDPAKLIGRILESVTFAEYAVGFNLSDDATLSIQYSYAFRGPGIRDSVVEAIPMTSSSVLTLVGSTISQSYWAAGAELVVQFDSGGELRCLINPDPFESYIISVDGSEWLA